MIPSNPDPHWPCSLSGYSPGRLMFQLDADKWKTLRSRPVTSNTTREGRRGFFLASCYASVSITLPSVAVVEPTWLRVPPDWLLSLAWLAWLACMAAF